MQGSGPTTFYAPPAIEPDIASGFGVSPMVLFASGLVFIGVYLAFLHRQRRRTDPRELAFRTITHKLGLTRTQVSTIRKQSIAMGFASPIGIVMSQELTAQALQD